MKTKNLLLALMALFATSAASASCIDSNLGEVPFSLANNNGVDEVQRFISTKSTVVKLNFANQELILADPQCLSEAIKLMQSFKIRVNGVSASLEGKFCTKIVIGNRVLFSLFGTDDGIVKSEVNRSFSCKLKNVIEIPKDLN